MKKTKVYTRTGDTGETSLLGGGRFAKSSEVFEVLGTLDELNAVLSFTSSTRVKEIEACVYEAQNTLFEIGALIADPKSHSGSYTYLDKKTQQMEKDIDKMDKKLDPLKNFILPGGSMDSCHLHMARAVCRRLERLIVRDIKDNPSLFAYINRLSDLFFVLARFSNKKLRYNDRIWKKSSQ